MKHASEFSYLDERLDEISRALDAADEALYEAHRSLDMLRIKQNIIYDNLLREDEKKD